MTRRVNVSLGRFKSVKDFGRFLGLSRNTIYRLYRAGLTEEEILRYARAYKEYQECKKMILKAQLEGRNVKI